MKKEDTPRKSERGSYPQPEIKDSQLRNQPEFIEAQPNDFQDPAIKEAPSTAGRETNQEDDEQMTE